jgi:hypothetical protein
MGFQVAGVLELTPFANDGLLMERWKVVVWITETIMKLGDHWEYNPQFEFLSTAFQAWLILDIPLIFTDDLMVFSL